MELIEEFDTVVVDSRKLLTMAPSKRTFQMTVEADEQRKIISIEPHQDRKTDWLTEIKDFNSMSTLLGLFYALRLRNHVHRAFLFIFSALSFLKSFFTYRYIWFYLTSYSVKFDTKSFYSVGHARIETCVTVTKRSLFLSAFLGRSKQIIPEVKAPGNQAINFKSPNQREHLVNFGMPGIVI